MENCNGSAASQREVDAAANAGHAESIDPHEEYTRVRATCQAQRTEQARHRTQLGYALLADAFVLAWVSLRAGHGYTGAVLMLGFAVLLGLLILYVRVGAAITRQDRLLLLYDRNLLRVQGTVMQSGATGENLRVPGHLYERDLNLLGPDSLFGLLDTVRTGIGQRGLADYLLKAVSAPESRARQQAVQELQCNLALRERIHLLGTSRFQQVDATFFDRWLEDVTPIFPAWMRPVLVLTSLSLIVLLVLGLTHVFLWSSLLPKLLAVGVLQSVLCAWVRPRVVPVLEAVARLSNHVQMFSDGLAHLGAESCAAAKLKDVQALAAAPGNAVPELKKLQSQVSLVQQRTKEYFYLFSLLLAAGTQAAITISGWKQRNGQAMKRWLAAWAEFEALNALATYAFEHPDDAWPELLDDDHKARVEAIGLAHPLLAGGVRNDVALGGERQFYLISGSNMSGKSTLMRTMGVNAVLAYAGAPVRAHAMRLTTLRIGASLALTDSLAEGKSKFLAEVERLQQVVRASEQGPVLFLVDEIFSGTNSVDRLAAAGAVLERLLKNGAIGALSTHDLTLAGLAGDGTGGSNVHMASPDADDPLGFDYRLKAGVNTSSNALAIIRMMGLAKL